MENTGLRGITLDPAVMFGNLGYISMFFRPPQIEGGIQPPLVNVSDPAAAAAPVPASQETQQEPATGPPSPSVPVAVQEHRGLHLVVTPYEEKHTPIFDFDERFVDASSQVSSEYDITGWEVSRHKDTGRLIHLPMCRQFNAQKSYNPIRLDEKQPEAQDISSANKRAAVAEKSHVTAIRCVQGVSLWKAPTAATMEKRPERLLETTPIGSRIRFIENEWNLTIPLADTAKSTEDVAIRLYGLFHGQGNIHITEDSSGLAITSATEALEFFSNTIPTNFDKALDKYVESMYAPDSQQGLEKLRDDMAGNVAQELAQAIETANSEWIVRKTRSVIPVLQRKSASNADKERAFANSIGACACSMVLHYSGGLFGDSQIFLVSAGGSYTTVTTPPTEAPAPAPPIVKRTRGKQRKEEVPLNRPPSKELEISGRIQANDDMLIKLTPMDWLHYPGLAGTGAWTRSLVGLVAIQSGNKTESELFTDATNLKPIRDEGKEIPWASSIVQQLQSLEPHSPDEISRELTEMGLLTTTYPLVDTEMIVLHTGRNDTNCEVRKYLGRVKEPFHSLAAATIATGVVNAIAKDDDDSFRACARPYRRRNRYTDYSTGYDVAAACIVLQFPPTSTPA